LPPAMLFFHWLKSCSHALSSLVVNVVPNSPATQSPTEVIPKEWLAGVTGLVIFGRQSLAHLELALVKMLLQTSSEHSQHLLRCMVQTPNTRADCVEFRTQHFKGHKLQIDRKLGASYQLQWGSDGRRHRCWECIRTCPAHLRSESACMKPCHESLLWKGQTGMHECPSRYALTKPSRLQTGADVSGLAHWWREQVLLCVSAVAFDCGLCRCRDYGL